MKMIKRETVADYLTYLEQRGIEKGYFELDEIRNIGSTCCLNATTLVVDFDKTAKKITESNNWKSVKSCDCLKIIPDKQCIDLIEMKSFKQIIDHFFRNKENDGKSVGDAINDKIANFNLVKKIEHSVYVLDNITLKKEFDQTHQDALFYRETKVNYIVLTDLDNINDSINHIILNVIFIAEYSHSIENYVATKLTAELDAIPNISHKLNKPMHKTCSEIDAYYAQ